MSNLTELELSAIRTDGGTQPRAELNQELIEEYATAMNAGAAFPPVTVFYDGTHYWLADGFHRVKAASKIGASKIAVDVHQGTLRYAVLHSVGVNATHGLRRSNDDKRRAVATLLYDGEWSQWSDREIARHAGVSDRFVNNLSKELTANGSQSTCRKGADGRIINTNNIGNRTRGLGDRNQLKSSPEETGAKPMEKDFSFPFVSFDPQKQLPSAITIDVKAKVVEDDEESSVPTETPPASTHQPQPERLLETPVQREPPEATSSELGPKLIQAEESTAKQEVNTLLDFEVGDRIRIESSQDRYYNGKIASTVQVNARHKTLAVLVNGAAPWNTVSVPLEQCTKIEVPGEASTEPDSNSTFQSQDPVLAGQFSIERYEVGDRVRILRRQHGKDNWAGKTARIWQITPDGWLRVDVEGHKGVKFTLKPNWVESMPELSPEQHNEQLEPVLDEGWADEPDPETPAISDIPLQAQAQGKAQPQFQAGDRLQVTNLGQQNQQWSGEVAEVLEVTEAEIKVTVRLPRQPI